MKILKGIYYSVMILIMAGCLGILICALNPGLTGRLAERVAKAQTAAPDEPGDGSVEGVDAPLPEESGTSPADGSEVQNGVPVQPGMKQDWTDGGKGYEIPDDMPAQAPASVNGKTGYEPVREDGEQIAQIEADNLWEVIAPGNTGDSLVFDGELYPYYAMLDENMRKLYRQIYANAAEFAVSFTPVTEVSMEQLKTVFEAVYNDHPELFWLDSGYYCKYLRNGRCVQITLKYNETADYPDRAKQAFEAASQVILPGARILKTDSEKEQYVHDALMQMVEYDAAAPMNQSAYSALAGGKTVCAGYARAFQYLMQQLGIPCYYCTGFAGEDHAWNIVKLDGIYYNVDVTWDDTEPATYDFYNKTDLEFAGTHARTGLSVYLPACGRETAEPEEEETDNSGLGDLINANPATPLVWESKIKAEDPVPEGEMTAEDHKKANLEAAGITEDQVRENMKAYYEDCLKQLKEVGVGDKQFSNVVPEALWNTLEQAYSSGEFRNGYVNEALKSMGAENFVIQLQVQRLGGGYYRLYHNVYTY